jgi:hypothetical protein
MIRCPTPPPIYERFIERVPTPEPEIIERVSFIFVQYIYKEISRMKMIYSLGYN